MARNMAMLRKEATAFFFLLNMFFFSHASPCPPPPSSTHHSGIAKCPEDTLKFGACGSWLGLVKEAVGTKPSKECCALVKGLADLEAAVCLCTAIKADVLGAIKFKVPVTISLLLNGCGKKTPDGFVCS